MEKQINKERLKERKKYLEGEIHSNHNDGYVREGLKKELKRLMESLNNIDSKEDNDIGNNDDETYGATFGMSY